MKSGRIFFGLIVLFAAACPALAQEAGKIMSIVGTAEVLRQERWQSVSLYEVLQAGDVVRTGSGSRVAVLLADGSQLKLNAHSRLVLKQVALSQVPVARRIIQTILDLLSGEIWVRNRGEPLEIKTLAVTATIRGTELNLAIEPTEATRLTVVEGVVDFRNPQGSVLVAAKEQATAKVGEAPRKVVVINPHDAVQWALYYPPLIDYREVTYPEGPDAQTIRRALEAYRRGDLAETLRILDQVPQERRNAQYFTLRAGLLLSVSRVAEARADIDGALRRDPSEAAAHALRSIIALVQNQKEEALRLARQAAALEPQAPVPQVALSYAYQAAFELDKALDSIKQAVKLAPEDALIQARLAELELSRGELDRALKAARRAVALDPELARTQTVLGFAYLTQIRIVQAKRAFERAITLDSADPLPRLGLGLAKIRESHLTEGVHEIEIATSLDPNNSLVRSYLGKAYYEEKRGVAATTELDIAKTLDPLDPTSWFYDAIRKQTTNRPITALQDLQKAMELNDNRAVYRSRLLLDEDRSVRSASLARIYDDLGFTQPARVIASRSLTANPANPSAHRFLADLYAREPRHEVARLSELLQWQLLQAPSGEAVQPHLQVSDLNVTPGIGASQPTFNEYSSLFERDRVRLWVSAFGGNHDSFGDEVLLTGHYRRFTLSLGQFHSDTNGFRTNADVENDLYMAFAQVALTPHLDVQGEYRSRETEQGDLNLNFDPGDFSTNERREIQQETARIGVRYRLAPHSDLIGSLIHGRRETTTEDIDALTGIALRQGNEDEGFQVEAQYLFRADPLSLTVGMKRYDLDKGSQTFEFGGFLTSNLDVSRDQSGVYFYSNLNWPRSLLWTAGLGYDRYEQKLGARGFELIDAVHPKLGVQWHLFDQLELRMAYMETAALSGVVDQTLEPTEVAGFNQWFDDFRGTEARRFGIGLDARLGDRLNVGVEGSWRRLTVPNQVPSVDDPPQITFQEEVWREQLVNAYLNWTPLDPWAASLEYQLDRFTLDRRIPDDRFRPGKVETMSVPLRLRYFSPRGPFAELGVSYVRQRVELAPPEDFPTDLEEFIVVDAALGYRLPKRWGVLSVRVTNLLDEEFLYQDDNFRTFEERYARFIPERTVLARIVVDF